MANEVKKNEANVAEMDKDQEMPAKETFLGKVGKAIGHGLGKAGKVIVKGGKYVLKGATYAGVATVTTVGVLKLMSPKDKYHEIPMQKDPQIDPSAACDATPFDDDAQ